MKVNKLMAITLLALCMLSLTGCKKKNHLVDDYPTLNEYSQIKELTGQKVVSMIENKETFIVVCGFPKCPWCQALMPVLSDVCDELKYTDIYYLNILDMRDNKSSPDKQYYEYLYTFAHEALDQAKDRINAPTILVVKEGKLNGFHLNTVESHTKGDDSILPPLTAEQMKELKTILKDLINKTF